MASRRALAVFTFLLLALTPLASLAAPRHSTQANTEALSISTTEILELAQVEAPPLGVGLQIHADFPARAPLTLAGMEVRALTAEITPLGTPRVVSLVTQQGRKSRQQPRRSTSECEDSHYSASGPTWSGVQMPIKWYFNRKSVPAYLSRLGTLQAFRKAHRAWPRELTNCQAMGNGFHFAFYGNTSRGVNFDGQNTIDFAELGRPLAVNYLWYSTDSIVEVDLRFNPKYRWTHHGGGRQGYQVINVATHELGHQLGLDDLGGEHSALTMFGQIGLGEVNKVTLGKGDLMGASQLSP